MMHGTEYNTNNFEAYINLQTEYKFLLESQHTYGKLWGFLPVHQPFIAKLCLGFIVIGLLIHLSMRIFGLELYFRWMRMIGFKTNFIRYHTTITFCFMRILQCMIIYFAFYFIFFLLIFPSINLLWIYHSIELSDNVFLTFWTPFLDIHFPVLEESEISSGIPGVIIVEQYFEYTLWAFVYHFFDYHHYLLIFWRFCILVFHLLSYATTLWSYLFFLRLYLDFSIVCLACERYRRMTKRGSYTEDFRFSYISFKTYDEVQNWLKSLYPGINKFFPNKNDIDSKWYNVEGFKTLFFAHLVLLIILPVCVPWFSFHYLMERDCIDSCINYLLEVLY